MGFKKVWFEKHLRLFAEFKNILKGFHKLAAEIKLQKIKSLRDRERTPGIYTSAVKKT